MRLSTVPTPRYGGGGKFDLAWQIRIVRALWADIDHVTVEVALATVEKAGLARPSAIVNSGYGVHLYWLLEQPYLIDDVGDPPPVLLDWRVEPNGKKKPHKYILEDGDRVFLDQRPLVANLSPKALAIQDTLAGIAHVVGGDHTTDLARILRVPGTFNRKDQRNGKSPVPTELIECEPDRRYPISAFDGFKRPAPASKRAQQIALMPLPTTKKISASKSDKLSQRIAACAVAEAGARSEADFALCCFAIRSGIEKAEVWGQVSGVGKFGERGESYFERTWSNAEEKVRIGLLDDLQKKDAPGAPWRIIEADGGSHLAPDDQHAVEVDSSNDRPTITVVRGHPAPPW